MLKAISFDLWNTLITPNESYAFVRDHAIAKYLDVDPLVAKDLYKKCKKVLDTIAEVDGVCFTTQNCWKYLCYFAGKKTVDYKRMMEECQEWFEVYPPNFSFDLISELLKLRSAGIVLSITSNTNFISGETLRKVVIDPSKVFNSEDSCIFSDELGLAKPNIAIFDVAMYSINQRKCPIWENETLHIGDNLICDGEGATNAGINFLHVKNPEDLLQKLKNGEVK